MNDPRPDLKEDSHLWSTVLACADKFEDKALQANLHSFRCAGSRLFFKDKKITMRISDEFSDKEKEMYKKKYLRAYLKQIKEIFAFLNDNYQNLNEEN